MSSTENVQAAEPNKSLRSKARGQLAMLLVQFLAGIAVSLLGMPEKTGGAGKIATTVILIFHVLVAIGLLVGAVLTIRPAARLTPPATTLAWVGAALIAVTFAAGILTMVTGSGWWSYLMAAGATVSLLIYGMLYLRTTR